MSGLDTRLWRVLHRAWLVLAIGVLVLLLGLGPSPAQGTSVLGLLIVLIAGVPVATTISRMPSPARGALRQLPRYRPMLALTAFLLTVVTLLVLCWTVANTLSPGTLTPLSLALVGVVAAGVTALLGSRLTRH